MQAIIQNQLYLQFRMHFHPFELPLNIKIVLQQSPESFVNGNSDKIGRQDSNTNSILILNYYT